VDGNGQRLQERALFIGNKIRKTVSPVLRNNEVGSEPSLPGAVLIANVLTEMIFPPEAKVTCSTDDHGLNSDPVSERDLRYGLTHFHHLSGNLVANGHGQGSQRVFPFVKVKVSPTDAAGLDFYQDVMGTEGRKPSFFKFYPPGGSNEGHGILIHTSFLF
jgi:hypothetical protein